MYISNYKIFEKWISFGIYIFVNFTEKCSTIIWNKNVSNYQFLKLKVSVYVVSEKRNNKELAFDLPGKILLSNENVHIGFISKGE